MTLATLQPPVSGAASNLKALYQSQVKLVTDLNRIIVQLEAAGGDAAAIAALEAAVTTINATLVDLQNQIDALVVSGGGLTSQQEYELSLVTAVESVLGSVSNLVQQSITESQRAAEATIKALIAGQRNKVALTTEQWSRLTENEALIAQITSLEAQLNSTDAAVTTEAIARADGDSSNAALINTVKSTADGNTAQISIIQTSVNGIEQKFAITTNANGHVTGVVQLDGTPTGSAFTVVADKFKVSLPSINAGAPVDVMAIGAVDGQPAIVWKGTMFGDGTINVKALNATEISAISANLGTVIAGKIQDAFVSPEYVFDVAIGLLARTDGTYNIDLKNKLFKITV